LRQLHHEKIWDPVTRLWHWSFALVVVAGWSFGEFMSFSTIRWHFYCGYTILGLLAFRFVWGFFGPASVRHRALIPKPTQVFAYLTDFVKREPSGARGHNPLGSLSVIVMMFLLTAQAFSGLFIVSDDYFESGPLSFLVSDVASNRLRWWHHLLSKFVVGIVCLHVAAIFYYFFWKKENLIKPMVTGWKWVKPESSSN